MIDRMSARTNRMQPVVQPSVLGLRSSARFGASELAKTAVPKTVEKPAVQLNGAQDRMRELVGLELVRVEATLTEVLRSHYPDVNALASRATSLGGKRLRPCLALLSAKAVGECQDDSVRVAATVELVHAASLVHDDVLDNATLRRHQPTIHAQVGAHCSIVLGDFLFTRAYGLAAQCRSTLAARGIASAASQLCEGELRQHASIGNWDISEADYFDILRQKTGELCAVSCRLGAWSGGGDVTAARALSRFGRKLGVAFQVVDDWLDVWGTEQVGKTLGTDLLQRKPTLPILRLLELHSGSARLALIAMLNSGSYCDEFLQRLNKSDASAYTLQRAKRLIESALEDLQDVPSSPARDCLESIAELCVRRAA